MFNYNTNHASKLIVRIVGRFCITEKQNILTCYTYAGLTKEEIQVLPAVSEDFGISTPVNPWSTLVNHDLYGCYRPRNVKKGTLMVPPIKINTKRVKSEVICDFLCYLSMGIGIELARTGYCILNNELQPSTFAAKQHMCRILNNNRHGVQTQSKFVVHVLVNGDS